MTDPSTSKESNSLPRYLFWKFLICILLTVPAFAAALFVSSLFSSAGGVPEDASGIVKYGRLLAALVGTAVFFLLTARIWRKLKLGALSLASFVLRETGAYALLLCLCALVCALTGGSLLQEGYASLFLLPHLLPAFFGKGVSCALLPFLLLLPYALLAALSYRLNRREEARRIARGNASIPGQFEEKSEGKKEERP